MPTARTALIECDQVSFAYGTIQAITDFSFSVAEGEIFGLLGPNGSGKSTIVRILSRVLRPYRGSVQLAGRDIKTYGREELARQIAVVPQETRIEMPFTALEVVLMGRSPHLEGMRFESARDLAIAYRAMEQAGVYDLAAREIHELSGGERQRVIFARALAQEPRVLLLDEPTAFLDIKHQVEVYDLVKQLSRQEGVTVVTVLHDLNLAALYCDHIALLKAGHLFCAGEPETVLTYAHIKAVYDTEVYIGLNDITGKVHVFPLDAENRRRIEQQHRELRLTN
jgi:iron complex transport system ATP-binding protein